MYEDRRLSITTQDRKKLAYVAFFLLCLFGFLIIQFFKLQVLEEPKWIQKARAQHQFVVTEPFKRGVFYSNGNLSSTHDDEMTPFVVDLPIFHLYIDPESIPQETKKNLAERLAPYLEKEGCKEKKIYEEACKVSRSRKIATALEREDKEKIEGFWFPFAKEHKLAKNALYFVEDYKRAYPYGKLLGQVLQTIRDEKEASTQQAIPTGGLEYYFDRILQGKEGKRRLLRSPRYPLDRGDVIENPMHGCDVYLTIHPFIQAICEEEIEKAVKQAMAKSGWIVMMDAKTGEILSLAQYPFFYPDQYKSYYADPLKIEHTKVKALTDCFEPGSIVKPLSFALALKANQERILQGQSPLFDPSEKVDIKKIQLPGRKTPMKDVSSSQFLNMDLALQKSSNVYTAHLIQKVVDHLGPQWYRSQLHDVFGFGKKTHVELPSEAVGFLPSVNKSYASGKLQWSTPTPACLAIGYNLLVNSLQIIKAYGVLASCGLDIEPSLVKKIVRQETQEVIYERKIIDKPRRVLEEEICKRVIESMKYVTKPGGSAYRADVPGFTEAGKTSTSEKIKGGTYAKNLHISTFAGFAPAHDAKIVALIVIDEPAYQNIPGVGPMHFGGKCAAPVFAQVAKKTLQYLGVTPDDPYGYPKEDPRFDPLKADMAKEVKALKELFYRWHSIK